MHGTLNVKIKKLIFGTEILPERLRSTYRNNSALPSFLWLSVRLKNTTAVERTFMEFYTGA
jgi:hypothetical protein